MPQLWPEFMNQDPIVSTFWPRLYELYPDFQFWVVDGKETVALRVHGACALGRDSRAPRDRLGAEQRRRGRPERPVRDRRRHRPRVPRPGPERGAAPADGRSRGGARARLHDRPGAADVEGALSADADRAVHALAPRGRAAVRPVAADARAPRCGDPRSGAALDDGHRLARRSGRSGRAFSSPRTATTSFPGALVPVRFEGGTGTYVEPNIWVRHPYERPVRPVPSAMAKPLEEWTPDELRFELARLTEELVARRARWRPRRRAKRKGSRRRRARVRELGARPGLGRDVHAGDGRGRVRHPSSERRARSSARSNASALAAVLATATSLPSR